MTLATATLAVLRPDETRIPMPELLGRLRPDFPDLRAEALGLALTAAGWKPAQWRTPSGRVRGYCPPSFRPVEQDRPAMPENPAADARDGAERHDDAAETPLPSSAVRIAVRGVGPGPHPVPPGVPCSVCGGTRWWRSRGRGDGWRCFCQGRPMPSETIIVREI